LQADCSLWWDDYEVKESKLGSVDEKVKKFPEEMSEELICGILCEDYFLIALP
jgi:hypothetical protein